MNNNRIYEAYYSKYDNVYADSRWAEPEEIKEVLMPFALGADAPAKGGIPFYVEGDTVFLDTSDGHTVVIGSSGSKKSRNIAIPQTILTLQAGESMIISDCKGEIYEWTSGIAQKEGYRIYVINLRDPLRSHRWNPFYEPWRLMHEEHNIDAAREMVNDFIDDLYAERSTKDPYWDDMAMRLFMGLSDVLLICSDLEEATIKSLIYLRNLGLDMNGRGFLVDLTEKLPRESFTYGNLTSVFSAPDRTCTSIISEFDSHLRLFGAQPNVTELFSGCDFDISTFGEEKTVLYLITPDEKTTYSKLISTFIHQAYSILISHATSLPGRLLPRRVNFILDEFGQLPLIKDFPSAITAARSRNIRFTLFVQSMYQLSSHYKEDAEIILGNMGNTLFLNSRELPLLDRISRLCGYDRYSHPLISPSQLQRLKNKECGEALLLCGSCYPFITHLRDVADYGFDTEHCPPAPLPVREEKSPLLDSDKVFRRKAWLMDMEYRFDPSEESSGNEEEDEDKDDDDDDFGMFLLSNLLKRRIMRDFDKDEDDSEDTDDSEDDEDDEDDEDEDNSEEDDDSEDEDEEDSEDEDEDEEDNEDADGENRETFTDTEEDEDNAE